MVVDCATFRYQDPELLGLLLSDFEATTSFGVGAPRHVPAEIAPRSALAEIVDELNSKVNTSEVNTCVADPRLKHPLKQFVEKRYCVTTDP